MGRFSAYLLNILNRLRKNATILQMMPSFFHSMVLPLWFRPHFSQSSSL